MLEIIHNGVYISVCLGMTIHTFMIKGYQAEFSHNPSKQQLCVKMPNSAPVQDEDEHLP